MQFILTNKVMRDSIKSDIQESIKVKNDLIEKSIDDIEKAAKLIIRCVLNGERFYGAGMVVVLQTHNTYPQNLWVV